MSAENNEFNHRDGVTLRDYFDARLKDNEKALDIASKELQIRLEGMNEFRSSMKDQAAHFLTREEFDAKSEVIVAKIDFLQKMLYIAFGVLFAVNYLLGFLK